MVDGCIISVLSIMHHMLDLPIYLFVCLFICEFADLHNLFFVNALNILPVSLFLHFRKHFQRVFIFFISTLMAVFLPLIELSSFSLHFLLSEFRASHTYLFHSRRKKLLHYEKTNS